MFKKILFFIFIVGMVSCQEDTFDEKQSTTTLLKTIQELELDLNTQQVQELPLDTQEAFLQYLLDNKTLIEAEQSAAIQDKNLGNTNMKQDYLELDLGEHMTFSICANQYWNDTQLWVEKNATYTISATGNWNDWKKETDADGFTNLYMNLWNSLKRFSGANWLTLVASVDQTDDKKIGSYGYLSPANSGVLYFYANDVKSSDGEENWYYNNNSGCINVTVHRLDTTDTDGDGIIDIYDPCPNEAGTPGGQGCVVNDSDNDGVLDIYDDCPTVYGTCPNGCPMGPDNTKCML